MLSTEILRKYTFDRLFKGIFVVKYTRWNYQISGRIFFNIRQSAWYWNYSDIRPNSNIDTLWVFSISGIRPDIKNGLISGPTLLYRYTLALLSHLEIECSRLTDQESSNSISNNLYITWQNKSIHILTDKNEFMKFIYLNKKFNWKFLQFWNLTQSNNFFQLKFRKIGLPYINLLVAKLFYNYLGDTRFSRPLIEIEFLFIL